MKKFYFFWILFICTKVFLSQGTYSLKNVSLTWNPSTTESNLKAVYSTSLLAVATPSGPGNGINEVKDEGLDFKIFPNPTSGSFKIQIDGEIEHCNLVLINSIGQEVHDQIIKSGINEINANGLSKGLYYYIVLRNKVQINKGKLIVE
jgi:hypothetical protein